MELEQTQNPPFVLHCNGLSHKLNWLGLSYRLAASSMVSPSWTLPPKPFHFPAPKPLFFIPSNTRPGWTTSTRVSSLEVTIFTCLGNTQLLTIWRPNLTLVTGTAFVSITAAFTFTMLREFVYCDVSMTIDRYLKSSWFMVAGKISGERVTSKYARAGTWNE